ncbi:Holliday junction resolvase RecU [Salisediminibacterium halotolerans]|uniref:Holliday junction resolvase RecU n=1 Tax=Salisediminibacterium halotolerans TaxID=517425 RepID=UPI000EB4A78A|nr:Holliday junction resolvase RecU [Salisediminibacterium halotolerans]RLJ77902.1 recombination protein U [Actinophytocola xinjiangensis]RPE88760.1 recombination protein U [Salisediminibacterium halotolerans]TWG36879.1 recombination protein U [Salisediminibacterium halotolerans]GEL09189.1 Holliday junction resolvase RecU [Salisediminibacterium halotolerans]
MAIRYPNGKKYTPKRILSENNNVKHKDERFSNRGMTLEEDINETNEYYRSRKIANIHKKPLPLQIVNVHYPKRSAAVVTEAYFKKPSTTDYNGVYKGFYLDFEAKETKNKTSFPFKNFHQHQIDHMKDIVSHGGCSFILMRFAKTEEVFLVKAEDFIPYYEDKTSKRKSLPKTIIEEISYPIAVGYHPRVDYLRVIDRILRLN